MRSLLFIFFCFMNISCKEKNMDPSENKSILYNEVMAIHDKVMPEMSTIHALKRDLKAIENKESKTLVINKIIELDKADEAMMVWMADFKLPEDKKTEEQYLAQEKLNIQNVSEKMFSSISTAKYLLDSLKSVKK